MRAPEQLARGVCAFPSSASVTPFRITLQATESPEWRDEPAVGLASGYFGMAGYVQVGDFQIPEISAMTIRAFFHPSVGSYALLYDHAQAGLVADVAQDFDDGTHLTVSCAPESGMDRPDHAPLIRLDAAVAEPATATCLHERLVAESQGRAAVPASAEDFPHVFAEAHAQEMDWRIARGGVTAREIRRAARIAGQDVPDGAVIDNVQSAWRAAIDAFVQEEVQQAWLADFPMSVPEWVRKRDRIRVIHEFSDPSARMDELAWAMVAGTVDEDDCEALQRAFDDARLRLRSAFAAGTPREVFAQAQELLPEKRRYELAGRVDTPWPGDIYLAPEDADTL